MSGPADPMRADGKLDPATAGNAPAPHEGDTMVLLGSPCEFMMRHTPGPSALSAIPCLANPTWLVAR